MSIRESFEEATRQHRAGRLAEAEALYRQILQADATCGDAWQMLGVAAFQQGRSAEAIGHLRKSLALNPENAACHSNLGMVLASLGSREQAINAFRKALAIRPDLFEALENLSTALRELGRLPEAIEALSKAVELRPGRADLLNKLGVLLIEADRMAEAIAVLAQAIAVQPDFALALGNLGLAHGHRGESGVAIEAFERAIARQPNVPEFHNNLGAALIADGRNPEAISALRRALALRPDYPQAHFNLGNAQHAQLNWVGAESEYRRAVSLRADYAEAWHNLGNALKEQARLDEAIACYQKAIDLGLCSFEVFGNLGSAVRTIGDLDEAIDLLRRAADLKPCSPPAQNLLYSIHLHPDYDARRIYQEHARWNRQCAQQLESSVRPHANDRAPDRRLRIGYVSPDFRRHPVGGSMLPILANHDRDRFEVFCYSGVHRADDMTAQLQTHASQWRDILPLTDEQAADQVRADAVDVLVDLAMHTEDSRMLLFARKPAPVQVTYLAYCGTTGLTAIDYRLSDPYLDPPGGDESVYSEKTIRLPETYWCYAPRPEAPAAGPLPAATAGHITFGCLNHFAKVSRPAIEAWQRLLGEVPRSALLLHSVQGAHRQKLRDRFASAGIDPHRIQFVERLPLGGYFEQYLRIDIAVDSFPYPGGATSLDALWMGVPVVTLAGQTAVSRGGASILSNAGLRELIANSSDRYIHIARELAFDLPRLAQLRATLRGRLQQSALTDGIRFTRAIESIYRHIWVRWCEDQPTS
ncbi:MAG TPA: tetratricopeptide repeat protein [Tepidisphaeraceae bacterium]|nr:tetratricopeptide repeat protein [Tepidisphaeraceae bacterium]